MSSIKPMTRARVSRPDIGPSVPTATVHLLFLAAAVGLCVLVLEPPIWLAMGLLFAVVGTAAPSMVPAWWLMLLLALSQWWREPSVNDVAYYLLIAGVHLLHVLGNLTRWLPWAGQMQLAAFVRPLRRFVVVQAIVQPVAVGALSLFGGSPGSIPGLSIAAAVMLGIVAAVLARGIKTTHSARDGSTIA